MSLPPLFKYPSYGPETVTVFAQSDAAGRLLFESSLYFEVCGGYYLRASTTQEWHLIEQIRFTHMDGAGLDPEIL